MHILSSFGRLLIFILCNEFMNLRITLAKNGKSADRLVEFNKKEVSYSGSIRKEFGYIMKVRN